MAEIKVLMYGWEFPPQISGGLGIACYAIVQELIKKGAKLTLVLPYALAPAPLAAVKIVSGAQLSQRSVQASNSGTLPNVLDSGCYLSPYSNAAASYGAQFGHRITLADFLVLLARLHLPPTLQEMAAAVVVAHYTTPTPAEKYGFNLLAEVFRYASVAGVLAQEIEHEIIHAHDWLTMVAALEAKYYSNKPLIVHVHALETDRSGLAVDKRIFAIEKYGMEQADHIVAVSAYTKDNIVHNYGIAPEKITVVHNGIYYHNMTTPAVTSRPPMVLFLGRITHQKGPSFFLEVARLVITKCPTIQFVLAGTGDLFQEMVMRTAKLRLGKNIHFTGFLSREEVAKIYQLATVYVMPSLSEPFGLAALEALSYGVPAIISKQAGVTEVLHHILVADFWDSVDMAAKILALLKYRALSCESLAHTQQELQTITWDKAADKLLKLYRNIILRE